MSSHSVRMEQVSLGKWVVEVDGVNIAGAMRRTGRLDMGDGVHPPTLSVELNLWPGFSADVPNARVEIDDKAREALLALGWAPPEGEHS